VLFVDSLDRVVLGVIILSQDVRGRNVGKNEIPKFPNISQLGDKNADKLFQNSLKK
jgi:hypothetical protein